MDIGAAIASLIREQGTSAAAICRATGIKPASMSKYISGQTEAPMHVLQMIAEQLQVHVCEIIARAEGVRINVPNEDETVKKTRLLLESLDERERYQLLAIAEVLKSDPPET